jgi:hypothetical protein
MTGAKLPGVTVVRKGHLEAAEVIVTALQYAVYRNFLNMLQTDIKQICLWILSVFHAKRRPHITVICLRFSI